MTLLKKNKSDILNDNKLNNCFLSAKLNNLDIECNIFKGNFYSDSFNYFPITENYETFPELFNWQVDNSLDHIFNEDFNNHLKEKINQFKIIENVFVLGSSPGDNYYSNLIYFLPRIFFNDKTEIKLVVHRNLSNKFRKFIKEICKSLKKNINFVYLDDDFYSFKNSYIPQFLEIKKSLKILNFFINNFDNSSNDNEDLKIYVSRQNTNYRNVVNEDDLIDLLKQNNFKIIDPNHLEIIEQIQLFSQAKFVISPTGSSLANIIFCKPGTKIIEISPDYKHHYEQNISKRYENLAQLVGLDFKKTMADSIKLNNISGLAKKYIDEKVLKESLHYSDLIVKINEFKKYLG